MLFRKSLSSTRTLLSLAAAAVFSVAGTGAASAANSGIAPLLVPYTIYTVAGNPQFAKGTTSPQVGYAGEGGLATPTLANQTGAVLNAPYAIAVDSVGNIYITDSANFIIREVNAQTGNITTIAGVAPKGCTGPACSLRTSGCDDGVPAAGAKIGIKNEGIAVDGYGNVYFADVTSVTVSVIYRGGAQVANFINLVNPAAVTKSGGVQPGYVYHIAGGINLTTCTGAKGPTDNGLAFTDTSAGAVPTATFGNISRPMFVSLDSAGNLYIGDSGNTTVRVINTQATDQTFFQYVVKPGYMRSITDCNATLTVACPIATTTSTTNNGINGPVNAIVYNSQYQDAQADAYGNVYQLNGTGGGTGPPGIYAAAAYAGGAPLTNLLTAEAPYLSGSYSSKLGNAPDELPLVYGSSYPVINNPSIPSTLPNLFPDVMVAQNSAFDVRPSSLIPDNFGTLWFMDNHYPELNRIDQYTGLATLILDGKRPTANIAPLNTSPASFSNPYYCVFGSTGSKIAWTQGPQTYDPQGDGCPVAVAEFAGGNFQTTDDSLGNIYVGDTSESLEREIVTGTLFPATAVGTATPVTQAIQVHFNSSNPPKLPGGTVADGPVTGSLTTSFSIAAGIPDFTINLTTPEFPFGSLIGGSAYGNTTTTANFQMWAGLPTCTQLGAFPTPSPVTDYDCLVYVSFNPTAPGVRQAQLTVTTANGSIYNFPLYGIGNGGLLAIDGGAATPVPATGLGTTAGIAVSQTGAVYIADPTNNRVVVLPAGGGAQTTIGTGLNGPMGVAVDTANNVYISDTGNNRVVEVNPITGAQVNLGNNVWVAGTSGISSAPGAPVTTESTTPPPQYQFKAPQGLAVDKWNNVYVADTGNHVVVEIPANIALGGAVPLLAYPGAPQFGNPVGLAVDSQGNIYVADTQNPTGSIVELPPGGGDLVTVPTAAFPNTRGTSLNAPAAVAVDAAGNVYVSDIGANTVVEIPAGTGVGTSQFNLNFPSISTPGGVALDATGNLYVADSGGKQVLFDNRQHPSIRFGNVPEDQSPAQPLCAASTVVDGSNVVQGGASCPLTITNIGNAGVTLTTPLTAVAGTANPAFAVADNNCGSLTTTGPLLPGVSCTISATFAPVSLGLASELVNINGGAQSLNLLAGTGVPPQAKVVLSASYSSGTTPTNGATATITATVTQPFVPGVTPTGTVTFTYAIDVENKNVNSCGTGGTQTVTLVPNGSGGATASFTLPTLAQGVTYSVNADYSGDAQNSANIAPIVSKTASALEVVVPGISVTSTVSSTPASLTFIYGGTPPVIVGTVTPTPPAGITVKFGSAATATSDISSPTNSYPVIVSFSGAGACAYGFPSSTFTNGSPAVMIENPAPLTYSLPAFTTQYGAPNLTYGAQQKIMGNVNGDGFGGTFVPSQSSILNANVSFTATETTGSAVLTNVAPANPTFLLSNLLGPQGGQPGMILTGTGIPAGNPPTAAYTTITAIGAGTVTMSANATATGTVTVNTGYEVIPTVIGKKRGDYTVTIVPGTLTVAQAPTAVSVSAAKSAVLNIGNVSFAATTTAGSSVLTGVASTPPTFLLSSLQVGQVVTGTGIAPATTITSVGANTVTMSANATASGNVTVTAAAGVAAATFQLAVSTAVPAGKGIPTGTVAVIDNYTPISSTLSPTPATSVTCFTAQNTLTGSTVCAPIFSGSFIPGQAVTITDVSAGASIYYTLDGTTPTPSSTLYTTPIALTTGQTLSAYAVVANHADSPLATVTLLALTAGVASYIPTSTSIGINQYSFAYSGDSNFQASTLAPAPTAAACIPSALVANCLIVDNPDFSLTSNTGPVLVNPGTVPSGNGLPAAPGQSSAAQGTAVLFVNAINQFTGTVSLSCVTQNPKYVKCFMTPASVCFATSATSACSNTQTTAAVVLAVFTPATLPLGFSNTAETRGFPTKTVLAFLPFGILAFCTRRRRRLHKALLTLIAVVAIGISISGCGGNQVAFYTPVPAGPQTVTVTATYLFSTAAPSQPAATRTYVVPITIE